MKKLSTDEKREYLSEIITAEAVADYLLADHGDKFGVYPHAEQKWDVGRNVGQEIDPDERPLIIIGCDGVEEGCYAEDMNAEIQTSGETLYTEDGESRLWTHEELVRDAVDMDADIKRDLLDLLIEEWEYAEERRAERLEQDEIEAEITAANGRVMAAHAAAWATKSTEEREVEFATYRRMNS